MVINNPQTAPKVDSRPDITNTSKRAPGFIQDKPHPRLTAILHFSLSRPLVTVNLLSVSVDLSLLDISHKRDHTIGGPACLPSLSMFSGLIHVAAYVTTTLLLMTECCSTVLMDMWLVSTFWWRSVVLRYTCTHKFWFLHLFSILWGIYPGVEFLGLKKTLCLAFWGKEVFFTIYLFDWLC